MLALLLLLQDPVKIDDHLAWVPQAAVERLKDRKNVPEELRALFTREHPLLVIVRGHASEILRADLRGGPVSRHILYLPLEEKCAAFTPAEDTFHDVDPPCVSEMLRCWPQWDETYPILGLQDGFFVCDDFDALPASLVAAAADARVKNAALAGLRNVFRRDAVDALKLAASASAVAKASLDHIFDSKQPGEDLNAFLTEQGERQQHRVSLFEPIVDLVDPNPDEKILKFLDHASPRVRRDALHLAWAKTLKAAAPRAEKLLSDAEAPVREAAVQTLARLGHPEVVIAALVDDPSPAVRRKVVSLLACKHAKALPLLADDDLAVRYEAIDYCARTDSGRDALTERLKAELEPEERVYVASTLLARFNDDTAAKPLADLLATDLPPNSRFDAIYALNRLRSPDAFAKLEKSTTSDLKSLEADSGLALDLKSDLKPKGPVDIAFRPSFGRLRAGLSVEILMRLDWAAAAIVLDGDRATVDSLDACADAMLKWWKTR